MSNPSTSHNYNITNDKQNISLSSPNMIYAVETGKKRKREFIEVNVAPLVKRTRYN